MSMLDFTSDFREIAIRVLGSLISVLVGFGISNAWRWFRLAAPVRRIWRLADDSDKRVQVQVIVATLTVRVNDYDRHSTGMGEAKAYAAIRESLLDAYGNKLRINLAFSYDYAESSNLSLNTTDPHIISLGGPRYNTMTERFHQHFSELPLSVVHNESNDPVAIINRLNDTRYEPLIEGEGEAKRVIQDYGLVSRLPSDGGNSDVTAFLIEGIRTYGVAAASRLLLSPLVKELHALVEEAHCKYWQALVRTQVAGASTTPVLIKESFVALDSQGRSLEN